MPTLKDICVATFLAVLAMRAVVGDEEDYGVVVDSVVLQGLADLLYAGVHLEKVVTIATWNNKEQIHSISNDAWRLRCTIKNATCKDGDPVQLTHYGHERYKEYIYQFCCFQFCKSGSVQNRTSKGEV